MTIKKLKFLLNTKSTTPNIKYYSSRKTVVKNKANSYLHASIYMLIIAMLFIAIGYLMIDYDESYLYDTKPTMNIILAPQDVNNLNTF